MKTIIFTGGGSAGHVIPNIPLIDVFLGQNISVAYIGSKTGIEKKIITQEKNIPYYAITCGKLRRYWSVQNFLDPFKIIVGICQAWWYLGKVKPDLLFSKGGFVAFPVVFAAWLRRIPTISHESDLTPGLANRLSFPFVKKIALTFAKTASIPLFASQPHKIKVTGTPVRENLLEGSAERGRQLCGFDAKKPCLLVIGGGSGATTVNQIIRQALPKLLPLVNVIHCCGEGKKSDIIQEGYQQFEYAQDELADLYACADVVISRAGANTVYEILTLNKPAIFIPLSRQSSRGDQIANARFFELQQLCEVIEETELNVDSLMRKLERVLAHRVEMQKKIQTYGIQSGTEAIIHLIREVIRGS